MKKNTVYSLIKIIHASLLILYAFVAIIPFITALFTLIVSTSQLCQDSTAYIIVGSLFAAVALMGWQYHLCVQYVGIYKQQIIPISSNIVSFWWQSFICSGLAYFITYSCLDIACATNHQLWSITEHDYAYLPFIITVMLPLPFTCTSVCGIAVYYFTLFTQTKPPINHIKKE